MSAIAAVFQRSGGGIDEGWVRAMLASMSHRAIDGNGVYAGGTALLGHGLTATTPESRIESQPLFFVDSGLSITADARLDNREELARLLGIDVTSLSSLGDAELILKAYHRWAADCPQYLIGDFAFAVHDARNRRLFVARDRMGVKPCYYFQSADFFACASEIKALLALPFVPDVLDELQIAAYLENVTLDRESTFYKSVKRHPAASVINIGRDAFDVQTYWALDTTRELRLNDSREYADAFRSTFEEAVRCRMRSVGPFGTALSGGLDSSSVTCMARDLARGTAAEPIHTFSSIFPTLPEAALRVIDEREYMDAVIETGGIKPHFFHADASSPLADMDRVLHHLDGPHLAYNLYLHWGMFRAASEQDIRVFLDGVDGDACVNYGFGLLEDLALAGEWDRFGEEAGQLSAVTGVAREQYLFRYGYRSLRHLMSRRRLLKAWRQSSAAGREFGLPPRSVFADNVYQTFVPEGVKTRWEMHRGRWQPRRSILCKELARATGIRKIAQERMVSGDLVQKSSRENHADWLMLPLYQYTFELADKAAAAFGIDIRYPFFDHRLLELSLSMPIREKLVGGWTRMVLREAMKDVLPEPVRKRVTKAGLGPAMERGLFRDRSLFARYFEDDSPIAPFVDSEAFRQLWKDFEQAGGDAALEVAQQVFRAALLARWLECKAR